MFGVNFSDPQTLWLNLTNVALGVVTLACLLVVGYSILLEVRERAQRRAAAGAGVDREMRDLIGSFDDHAMHLPELGLTMADGGEKIEPEKKPRTARPKK
jgi:hypothetical protein